MRSKEVLMQEIHDHVFSQIGKVALETSPFAHCYVRDVFPRDFYSLLIEQLPTDDRYERLPAPYESRSSIRLDSHAAASMGEFWRTFEQWINGQDFLDCMVEKFSPMLPTMNRFRAAQLAASSDGSTLKISSRTEVVRDYANFALGPHTDNPLKFVTAIFYISKDLRFSEFGTSIYRPKKPGFTCWTSNHYPHDQFELIRTYPNVPNSVFVFVKTDYSFHGVEPGAYPDDGRNMLQWAPQIGDTEKALAQLRLPRRMFESSQAVWTCPSFL
jgi:hypothetical protein